MIKQRLELEITGMTHQGLGVGKYHDFTYFIPFALKGEKVICEVEKVKKNHGYAKLIKIIESSPLRVRARCNIFGVCGGCDIMHLDYNHQMKFKEQMVKETFWKFGNLNLDIDDVIGMDEPYYYRNKVQVPFSSKEGKVICGYYRKKSHDIAAFDYCYIQPEYVTDIIIYIRNLANEYKITSYNEETKKGLIRHILVRNNYKGEVMIVFITNEVKFPYLNTIIDKVTKRYPRVKSIIQNINQKATNVILGNKHKVIYGDDYIVDKIKDLFFNVSHYSFFQVNLKQTEKLYQKILDYLEPKENDIIIDGYCGVGTISLMIAKRCKKVYGIELVNDAIINARENAKLNKITNAEFIVGKVETEIDELINENINAIVLDPPRKGVKVEVLQSIIDNKIPKLVYVSCNVATLARDLKILNEYYEVQKVSIVDMFPQTANVEAVTLLKRK